MYNQRSGYIDQWRGIAILAVIACHANPARFLPDPHNKIFTVLALCLAKLGPLGVETFFVISGFLITDLLLREENRTNSVSLLAFYVRRITRIIPALLVYVLTVALLNAAGFIRLEPEAATKAVSFLCNTRFVSCADQFGQLWTLGVEEQFYLLWPLLLIVSGRFRVALVTIALVIGAICAVVPSLMVWAHANNGMAVYCLSSGALFALSPSFRRAFEAIRIPTWALLVPLLFLTPLYLDEGWHVGHPLAMLVTPPIFVAVVLGRQEVLLGTRFSEGLRQLGLLSYSLYLWHVIALLVAQKSLSPTLRLLSLLALPAAWVSYRFIELPFISLGRRWSKAIIEGRGRLRANLSRQLI